MLTMLGWASAPHPFPKKAQVKPQQVGPTFPVERRSMKGLIAKLLQNFVLGAPRVQTYTTAHTSPTFSYSVSGSYVLSPSSYGHAGHSAATSPTTYAQPPQQYGKPHAPSGPLDRVPSAHHGRSSASPTDGRNPFKIYPSPNNALAAFIYERSEDARSDTMTSYSSSTGDTSSIYSSTTATSSAVSQVDYGRDPRRQTSPTSLAGPSRDAMAPPSHPLQAPHRPPIPLPPSSNASSLIVRESSNLRGADAPLSYSSPPGRAPDPSRRRGSGSSASDDAVMHNLRPNVLRKSPPGIDSSVQFPGGVQRDGYSSDNYDYRVGYSRVASGMATPGPSREALPLHRDDSHIDMQRSRRLSGAPMPAGIREHTSPVEVPGHDFRVPPPTSNAVVLRNTPSRDRPYYTPLESPRDRTSPDRFPPELIRERRMSIAGSPTELPGYFDRPTLGRRSSVSSRGRSSPPEEFPRLHTSKPIPIRARTLSKSEILRGLREPNVAIAGVEPIAQARTVRFSENLICPSPIPRDRRRKGWFNKRGYFNFHNSGNLAN